MGKIRCYVLVGLMWVGPLMGQETMSPEELEVWFNSEVDAEAQALAVNEGELVFLAQPPDKAVHRLYNQLTVRPASLEDGFVELYQCHEQLDAVPEAEVVYRYQRLRNLRIDAHSGIDKVWVEGSSVQMVNIHQAARLCIRAEVGVLYANADGSYSLRSGPFHRRFLDGYYPMNVRLDIRFPQTLLRFTVINPPPQPGFQLLPSATGLQVDAWFEGRLTIEARFVSAGQAK